MHKCYLFSEMYPKKFHSKIYILESYYYILYT